MLTSYDQYLDAWREFCRAQADLTATALADAERINAAAARLIETLQMRHAASRTQIEAASNLEELFDVNATTLGEDIGSTADTFMQMWREIIEVQTRAAHRLPMHLNELGNQWARIMRIAGSVPQPLIPLGTWLYGLIPDDARRDHNTAATPAPAGVSGGQTRERVAG